MKSNKTEDWWLSPKNYTDLPEGRAERTEGSQILINKGKEKTRASSIKYHDKIQVSSIMTRCKTSIMEVKRLFQYHNKDFKGKEAWKKGHRFCWLEIIDDLWVATEE